MKYRLKPRDVEAAQWSIDRPGDVIGMLANCGLDWERDGDNLTVVCMDNTRFPMAPTCWVVVDEEEAGEEVKVYADARFRDLFEARITRGATPLVG